MAPETSSSSTESTVVATTETTESTDTITGMTTTTVVSETTSTSTSTTAATTTSVPEVSFRGRTLKGTVIPVPEGYIGTIYKSYDAPAAAHAQKYNRDEDEAMDEDQEYEAMLNGMQEERKALRTKAQFKEFMMWGHDEQPTLRSEKVVRAMQWFDIAKVLHEPLMG
ncbi:hypothetical protein BGZ54_006866 [Gamsiella multidivaricata]|nr:hypothetical protein BGZ54_006866 [Gamsiella multidivaricata]